MKILIISDFLYKQTLSSRDEIEYIKWNDGKLPSLGGYDAIVIDMTFESKEINDNKIKLLYELKTTTEKPGYLSKKNLILVVVCGSLKEDFKFDKPYDDKPYDKGAADKVYWEQDFSSYDFLKTVIPEFMDRVEHGESTHFYSTSLSLISINLYLDSYKSVPTYLCYDYDPDSEKCVDVTPLAKMKEKGRDCVAFECKSGRGLSVILPSYDIKDAKKALSLLLCRRALEESAIHQGSRGKKFLREKIEKLFKNNIIDSNMRDVAIEIIEFGNWGAHAGKYPGRSITEEDVILAIDFLGIYFDYTYCIQDRLKRSAERRQELNKKTIGGNT